MRAYYVLLAAAVALLASCDAVSATAVSKVDSVRTSATNNRLLRVHGDEDSDDLTEESEDEERGMGEVSEKAASSVTKLTKGTSGLNKADDELAALAAQSAETFKKVMGFAPRSNPKLKWDVIDADNLALFQKIRDQGWTPTTMASNLAISTKESLMTGKQLARDPEYLLYMQYSAWWDAITELARKAHNVA